MEGESAFIFCKGRGSCEEQGKYLNSCAVQHNCHWDLSQHLNVTNLISHKHFYAKWKNWFDNSVLKMSACLITTVVNYILEGAALEGNWGSPKISLDTQNNTRSNMSRSAVEMLLHAYMSLCVCVHISVWIWTKPKTHCAKSLYSELSSYILISHF